MKGEVYRGKTPKNENEKLSKFSMELTKKEGVRLWRNHLGEGLFFFGKLGVWTY